MSGKDDFEKSIEELCSSARNMLQSFPEKVREFVQLQLDGCEKGVPPEMLIVVEQLKILFSSVKNRVKQYIQATRDVASYVCESGVMGEVRQDLTDQNTEALLQFVDDLKDYLVKCELRLSDLDTEAKRFETNVTQNCRQWEEEKKQAETNAAYYRGVSDGWILAGYMLAVLAPLTIKASPSMASVGRHAPLATNIAGTLMCAGAVAAPSVSSMYAIKQVNSERQKLNIEEAIRRIGELCEVKCDILINVKTMKANLETIRRYIEEEEGVKGLDGEAQSPEYQEKSGRRVLKERHKISTNLTRLEDVMKEVFEDAKRARVV